MIDWHSHILPGVDDGSRDIEESISILKMLSEQGVETVIATPHAGTSEATRKGANIHFYFTNVNGVKKTLNASTEADIPESRWVYATADLTSYNYVSLPDPQLNIWGREPSFIRTYIKPTKPAVHTFYFDDFTLDYSSAVEDRVLPTISNVCYATQDTALTLADGAAISSNTMSFSANVADNLGLDNNSGKVYVDGVELDNVTIANKTLSSADVTLTNGVHTVTFEVADNLGNLAKVTRKITVGSDALITLTGHNESGAPAEYGSIYYVDVNVADLTAIDTLKTTIKLQNANTWETEGTVVANGFKATLNYNEISNLLDVTVERNGEAIATDTNTLISIPVRVWTWDAINHVTGEAITPETQFATGNCPIVTIDCEVVYGSVDFAGKDYSQYLGAFGGEFSVATNLNDNLNAWHYHTATALADKAATCTEDGYTGRTYCEVCSSVVEWGTAVEATGHNFQMNSENKMVCECGEEKLINGLYKDGDVYRYLMNGVAKSGWFTVDKDWYYFHADTMAAKAGTYKVGAITYEFEETGKLVSGVWADTLFGTRYYYGPSCYPYGWQTIDGQKYYFEDTYRYEGYRMIFKGNVRSWYYFDENGVCSDETIPDGFYTEEKGTSYVKDGVAMTGLFKVDGDYYLGGYWGYLATGSQYADTTHCDLPVGNYEFGEDGKMLQGIVAKEDGNYYYSNGRVGKAGLTKVGNDYYYVSWTGKCSTGKVYASYTNCDLPVGNYYFDADGKLANGLVETEDGLVYVENGKTSSSYAGLHKIGDDYYFVTWGGVCATGYKFVEKSFCNLPAGNYEFGADGKMLNGIVEKNGKLYYYVNGITGSYGLVKVGEDYYFSNWGGVVMTEGRYYVGTTRCDLPVGNYEFGADGKMLDGIVEKDGKLYHYVNGITGTYGLVKVDGDYYFSNWGGVVMTSGRYFVGTSFCDLLAGNYEFGADGKMLNGIVEKDGKLYHYINGLTGRYGLVKVGDDYYFSNWGGVIMTSGVYYVGTTYCDLPVGNYEFGADGKMLNGIVEKDGKLYNYKNGLTGTYGLIKVGDDYYLSGWGGVILTGKQYVGTTYCDLPVGNYEFAEDGKMLNGFITREDGIYYYKNGSTPAPGLIKEGDYYYFVSWGGKLITDQTYYVWATNGLSIETNYKFDELGRIYA